MKNQPIFSFFICLFIFASGGGSAQSAVGGSEERRAAETELSAREAALDWNRESCEKSVALFREAAELWVKIGRPEDSAYCLREAGRVSLILGDDDAAKVCFTRSLRESSRRNSSEQIKTLSELSLFFLQKGETEKSRRHFEKAMLMARRTADASASAEAFFSASDYYYSQRDIGKAIEFSRRAVELWRGENDAGGEAKGLLNLGYAYLYDSQYALALTVLEQSLNKSKELGDRRGQALALIAAGNVYSTIDEKQAAFDSYKTAESLFPDDLDFVDKARLFNGIGSILENYGEWRQSIDYRQKALQHFEKKNYLYGELATLANLANLYTFTGDREEALNFYEKARKLAEKLNDTYYLTVIKQDLGFFYFKNDLFEKAAEQYEQAAILLRKMNSPRLNSIVYERIAQVHQKQNRFAPARKFYLLSLDFNKTVKNKFAEAETNYRISSLNTSERNYAEALDLIRHSVKITETLSSDVFNSSLKNTYFSNVFERYELYINLLMKMNEQSPNENYAIEALQAAEKSRTRSMLENLALAEADFIKDASPEVVKREKEIRVLLNSKADKLTDLLSSNADRATTEKLDNEINELEHKLEEIKATLKQNSPIYSAIKNPAPFDVGEFQRDVLDENSLLLEFSFGKEESYLWLVSKTELNSYVLPPREQIESRIEKLRKLIDSRGMLEGETVESYQARISEAEITYKFESKQLSDALFGQVGDKLSSKRLIIVPDGKLHYFPVAALPFPNSIDGQPILLTNEVIYEPSAATLALLMRKGRKSSAATKNLLVFSDPIFSNQDARIANTGTASEIKPDDNSLKVEKFRFAESLTSLVRLNASKDEADSIVDIMGAEDSTTLSGAAATRERALDASIADYKIVHFATHGLIKEDRPELSGIVLSQVDESGQATNGVVRLQDIYAMNLTADAVILSACSTGIGKEVKGEGLMSLNNAFLQTGAKSVVSSLWKVDDYAAQELMKNFYREMATGNATTSEALRRAQIKLRENPQYQSPFYWAAFTIQGDYKTIPQISRRFDRRLFGLLIVPFALLGIYFYRRRLN